MVQFLWQNALIFLFLEEYGDGAGWAVPPSVGVFECGDPIGPGIPRASGNEIGEALLSRMSCSLDMTFWKRNSLFWKRNRKKEEEEEAGGHRDACSDDLFVYLKEFHPPYPTITQWTHWLTTCMFSSKWALDEGTHLFLWYVGCLAQQGVVGYIYRLCSAEKFKLKVHFFKCIPISLQDTWSVIACMCQQTICPCIKNSNNKSTICCNFLPNHSRSF